ncbi:ArsA family ATPase [Kineosporia rhizophila]|uniref:ArsA family ATPase n=1 Tax=Kineosporia TaxID=49184 RepID=UPI001E3A30EB|nr:ArsA family ATPase [Kineosporia sp. NBRC 101677]MCE0538325.1 ArsA family ATPase [Kineosporia rhizophila]GLY18619.1 arsenic-transporting ATPase [Kineosporia sp. NBRC 101677]
MRLLVITGPGGVGKTTVAAATGVQAAQLGSKVLVASLDPAQSLADGLDAALGPEPVEVAAGLWAVQVDAPATAARIWAPVQEIAQDALEELGVDPVSAEDLAGLPGLDELFALLAVAEQVRSGRWDLVVLDCPPSVPAFRLLSAPQALGRLLQRLLPIERRIGRLLDPGRTGDPLVEAVDRLAGELTSVGAVLSADSTSVRLVLTPEAGVVAGCRRLFTALSMAGFAVDAVVANRVLPTFGPQLKTSVSESAPTSTIGWMGERVRRQETVLNDLAESFGSVPVVRIEHAAQEPRGLGQLSALGAELSPVLDEPLPPMPRFEIDRSESGFTLRLPMPLARREELDLGRRGDELVIAVDGYRSVLALPSVLRRCQVQGARLREGVLSVEFVPDPDEFPSRWL